MRNRGLWLPQQLNLVEAAAQPKLRLQLLFGERARGSGMGVSPVRLMFRFAAAPCDLQISNAHTYSLILCSLDLEDPITEVLGPRYYIYPQWLNPV